ncbi:mannose-1-phosphate guanylyltransferase/mannose-6-phosphate isomerase [Desulfolutivibrio sulfoxidireducens]|uniref:mannose-1-phosphate guanylyltransferase/mannose-6-phosphate isomerase n=1 Tax=Desulfolutivibrio sulfoxidireducens TaxID=2773299 RepID=UPI00159E10A2|nr:mannose-1-phosphate guanylyltransferase/mannose-6-phosphate isomerase [Desulfolutivibrio sulfoxidireducens]QLA15842.1 mannose-1-phosphate guanylyltransferase/mannose-6-phosphate isomerase [Desulfolutivibrio sulfoxidireducens]QLA20256.1 mannose-1-phosphate guanylyltransferase/mannose-6-phosphate isomerase [Desulfolutivibrio sulfoxidireducens]
MAQPTSSLPASPDAPAFPPSAIILAGGSGTRLWPLSRTLLPKQLLALSGKNTLLQDTLARTLTLFSAERTWVATNEEHVYEVRGQLRQVDPGLDGRVLAEPVGKNTLPAILLGLDRILGEAGAESAGPTVVGVFPADHMVTDATAWKSCMERGLGLARDGWLVTFGIPPAGPETGYGYIHRGRAVGDGGYTVLGFTEKPGLEAAKAMLRQGGYLWNSGMYLFRADVFLEAVERFVPRLWAWWLARRETPLVEGYGGIPDLSVDYGIVEKMERIAVVEAAFDWDDLGSWEALYRLGTKDRNGCVIQGDVLALDCRDSLLVSRGGKLAATGLRDVIVVQTRDATLVCPLSGVQGVKDLVAALRAQGSSLVQAHVTVRRPWGSYTVLEEGPGYKIKRIEVLPGASLSLQMHHHRSEHWVVIAGTARVQVGEQSFLLAENQSVDIPKTTPHRLANPGKVPAEIIEIQSGPYLEEDDIVRFDDVYGRRVDGGGGTGAAGQAG